MFEPKMVNFLALFWLVKEHMLLDIEGYFSSERLLCIMSNVGWWAGIPRYKYKEVTTPECWLLVMVGTQTWIVLVQKSPCMNISY